MVVSSGDIFRGLVYTIVVSLLTLAVGAICIRDRRGLDMGEPMTSTENLRPTSTLAAAER
jgi:hypothetical protein